MPDAQLPVEGGTLPGYLATPSGTGPWPAVVVIHEVFGLTDDIRRIADRFAANGYLAFAPALFQRGPKPLCIVSAFRALASGSGSAVDDLIGAAEALRADDRTTGKVGSAGFCMGGGFCLLLADRGVFDATAPNYGPFPPAVGVPSRSCPIVASYGARDVLLPGAAAKLERGLAPSGVARDIKEYPGVGHSFMNEWKTPSAVHVVERIAGVHHSAPQAEDAWRRILTFFDEHLR
ncbi:dienelactone hydrolase family protein [Mycolicibacterium grossiae]|uniref:Carboxymethylenebutenolidase n=1 Tax=Mycolicibacterium grossiae TaxID=1552759 RepID=A0A1E8Q8X4_9MYCO|nr:dienelactone hydrolase family protein [Mycolicibacterium grossiae]OFJ54922.1 carboxymethylenebutenolidase [Mycolicibacterium grossiae]QEM44613.1 dienelactone hydrolase family protein [Mycolicibacterium grossiae]